MSVNLYHGNDLSSFHGKYIPRSVSQCVLYCIDESDMGDGVKSEAVNSVDVKMILEKARHVTMHRFNPLPERTHERTLLNKQIQGTSEYHGPPDAGNTGGPLCGGG